MKKTSRSENYDGDIAIVGLSLTVPGAATPDAFWDNLRDGVESIQVLDEQALLDAGERPEVIAQDNYVPAAARLDDFDMFDADFFGFSPKEAAILDPQHRKFLEVAWEAMETAGHPPETIDGPIGVYAGCGMGSYFYFNICSNPALVDDVGMFLLRHTGNDKDFMSTRVSHVFDLKGPSLSLQTACSTSLVAVHYACQALRSGEVAMALAGGVTIEMPQGRGYLYKENEVLSPDGHCHAFDHRAQGTVFGSGAGTVVLRRLDDAIADGDHIWAIIKGSAVNNDGAAKAGYLAPSVDGQAAAIEMALQASNVAADTVDYVECHGTGTYLGDPIEVSALTEAFRETTQDVGYCRVGSVKTNIGHLDTAAGVVGLIKTTLALHNKQIPPSLGYEAPNPAIDFETSPFKVNDTLRDWISHKGPRRAGVNALGVGGTNAHTVLEEAPVRGASDESDFPFQVLCLSGRSKSALDANSRSVAAHLRANPDLSLADVAFTLKNGRRGFDKRRVLVAETALQAAELLESGNPRRVFGHDRLGDSPDVVFMFPGGGAQYPNMARDLYETEPVFAEWMDKGLDHLEPQLDFDLRALWMPDEGQEDAAATTLQKPSVQLPLIMIVEYALAQLWLSWGVRPAALVGHSMGENTAACLAGVLSFEDCIDLVLLRGRLFDTVPAGGMLSVSLPVDELRAQISDDLDIASVNAPNLSAVSGPQQALDQLAETLTARDIDHQRVQIDIAAHSRMLDPILDEFCTFLRGLDLHAPEIPVLSNRTGTYLTDTEATDPDYWVGQLRNTVLYADCIATLTEGPKRVFLEVGPGKALSSLTQMSGGVAPGQVMGTLRHPDEAIADDMYFMGVIGRLWATGVEADWDQIWGEAKRHRLPLPTYAFQRSRYFIERGAQTAQDTAPAALMRDDNIANWGYQPAWRPRFADCDTDVTGDLADSTPQNWLIFEDDGAVAARVSDRLTAAGHTVSRVTPGDTYAQLAEDRYILSPEQGRSGYDSLLADLALAGRSPTRIGHFWLVTQGETYRPGSSFSDRNQEQGFFSLMGLSQALGAGDLDDAVHITVFTNGAAQVRDEPLPYPEKAMIAGPAGVVPHEMPGLTIATLDIELPRAKPTGFMARLQGAGDDEGSDTLTQHLLEELLAEPAKTTAAWRGARRYEQFYKPVALTDDLPATFTKGGTYLITGGFGGIGLTVAADLVQNFDANVVLVNRTALPDEADWASYLHSHSVNDPTCRRIRALQDLHAMGGMVMTVAADVCNGAQMAKAVAAASARFGKINGVIHGAGAINDAPVLGKSVQDAQQVFAPKITGLKVIEALFPDGELDLLVLFSSSSTVTRPAGQIDYVAANEYLNAYAKSRRGGATRVCAVDWGVWGTVGMASDAMTQRQGTFADEITDANVPMLATAGFDAQGSRIFTATYAAQTDWFLNEHRTGAGDALLPGTGFVELAAQALKAHGIDTPFDIRDLYFLRPLHVQDAKDIVVRLQPTPDGFDFNVFSAITLQGEQGYLLNAQASIALLPDTELMQDIAAIAARCPVTDTGGTDRLKSPQEAHLQFGPRWHVLNQTAFGDGEGLAQLALSAAFRQDLNDGYLLHPALLDLATGWAVNLIDGYQARNLWVPLAYKSIRVLSPLPADIRSWVRLSPDAPAGFAAFDVTLMAPDGRVCVQIQGFQMKRVTGALNFAPADSFDADAATLGLTTAVAQPLSPDEQRLFHNIKQGIRADEGAEALHRALALGKAQVIVSSLDLKGLIAQADLLSAPTADAGQTFERPDLDSAYIAPSNDIEQTLAGFWENLLGVSQIGVDDNFFDLGGHSLIAVRLFAQISRAYDVEFPISVLFEAPTVAKCAALIAARTGLSLDNTDTAPKPQDPVKTHTHLVTLHHGDNSAKTPFFLVAGMFGNVLNLRHLALMLGQDRPVYGFQARGLIGDDEPHQTVQAAATDYIAELRQVQPKGPYLLGGFSGGGITAYEMVQQLEAEGEEVALLAMLDTPLPVRPSLNKQDKALIKLHELRRKGVSYFGEWIGNRLQWELQKRQKATATPAATPEFNNARIESAFRAAVEAYDLKPWDGPLVLFRPPLDKHWKVSGGHWVSAAREYVLDDNDWTKWAPETRVVEVPGDHDSMVLIPNVSVLAEHLKDAIDQAVSGRISAPEPSLDWLEATAAE